MGFASGGQHLREELPGPEGDPGPQLPEEDSPGQVRLDLRQQLRGLPLQPGGVRQQAVIHHLPLRDKPIHISIHSHIPLMYQVTLMREKKE